MDRSKQNRAFTLVELLVVVGIIAVLTAILLPSLAKARASAKNIKCMSNLRQLTQGLLMYANANRGSTPYYFQFYSAATSPGIGEFGNSSWADRIGNPAVGPVYVAYNNQTYAGSVWNCPFAVNEVPNPWFFQGRFSFHYSVNAWLLGRRNADGSFPTFSDGYRQCKRLNQIRPDLIVLTDGRLYSSGSGSYFESEIGYDSMQATASGVYGGSPWPIDKPGVKITRHNKTVNVSRIDGSVESIRDTWPILEMPSRFLPFKK